MESLAIFNEAETLSTCSVWSILYHKIQSVCVCMLARNRLPNHAYYGDEAFAGDSVGVGLGQRINFI